MNYYNPYLGGYPYTMGMMSAPTASKGLFGGLLSSVRGINWASIIGNTQKTLGIVNQAIPVIKQVTPVVRNAKTMFRVMNEFKRVDSPAQTKTAPTQTKPVPKEAVADTKAVVPSENIIEQSTSSSYLESGPTFFV